MTTGSVNVVRRTCRRVGLDRNPMRRREDRLQAGVGALLTVLVLLAVPLVALLLGKPLYEEENRAVQAETAQLHRVDATVLEVGQAPLYAPVTPVKVSWRETDGSTRVADYHSTVLVKPGATVPVWLNDSGRVVEPPSATRPLSRALFTCSAIIFAVLIGCSGGYLMLRTGLDRRRARMWESEWATAGLTWGGHNAT
ncbi:hypothetical protein [Nocardia sp. NPDC050710]|uniref:Rv1733c family protein n=1 Tax=Nocardia sp. NPDC050710 TaxID=3157220 RepID=UPI0033D45721